MKEIAIVTGGSSGLGFSIAKRLSESGIETALIGRSLSRLQESRQKLNNTSMLIFNGNIADEAFVSVAYKSIAASGYTVKYLFNCAATGKFGDADKNTKADLDTVLEGSLIGLVLMSTLGLSSMSVEGGTIINVMSTAALKGNPSETLYCAAKWGARGYTEALKAATKGTKVKVVGVYPGGMNTPFWSDNCGLKPDTSKFMNPHEVALQIVNAILPQNTLYVSDITIDRK